MTEQAKDFFSAIPEGFYDAVAYIIPALYLTVGIELLFGWISPGIQYYFTISRSWVIDLSVALVALGGLYLVGQVLTVISYYSIITLLKLLGIYEKEKWNKTYRWFEINLPSVAVLITKRYARWIAAQNMASSSLILMILSLIFCNCIYAVVFGSICVIFILDIIVRYKWLDWYCNTLVMMSQKKNLDNLD